MAVFSMPVVFFKSAPAPTAVFPSTVFESSAPRAYSCVKACGRIARLRQETNSGVVLAAGQKQERLLPYRSITPGIKVTRRRSNRVHFRSAHLKREQCRRNENYSHG